MNHVWLNGALVPETRATVSIRTHALHYGTSAFEGIRFYETAGGPAIFRLDDHLRRLQYSATVLGMNVPYSRKQLAQAIVDTVRKSKLRSGYIRPLVFYGESPLGVMTKGVPVDVAIIVLPWGKYLPPRGINLKVASVRRFNPSAFDPNAKIGGVYVNSVIARQEAAKGGFDEALILSDSGALAEGSGENIFIVQKGKLYTPRLGNILPGITRDSIIRLAKDLTIACVEKPLTLADCLAADEVFLTGTAAEVTPVASIDRKKIGTGTSGPLTERFAAAYSDVVVGHTARYQKWLTLV